MTTSKTSNAQAKRTDIAKRVSAAEKRNADRGLADFASDARDSATAFVKEHPIKTVVGGLAIGALIAAIVPGPGRRLRRKASARSAMIAGVVADLAATYGKEFLDGAGKAARSGQDKLGDLGGAISAGASSARKEAGAAGEHAADTARSLGKAAVRSLRELRARMN